ncbi:MAG TPA: ECF transporter S component [Firmicutes bacterium]|nr:ECF transporter S component [Bacillota bacterium]
MVKVNRNADGVDPGVGVAPGAGSRIRNLVWGALFVALGIVLPIAFHAIGAGPVFLPMHIPVLLAGFFVGPAMGAAVGFLTPILSAVLTGMPPLMPPVAQMMMVELAVYGFLTGFLYGRLRQNAIISLVGAMFAGRVVYGVLGAYLLPLFGLKAIPVFYPITLGVVKSLPGILIQLVLIPAVIYLAEGSTRAGVLFSRNRDGACKGAGQ